MLIDSRERIQAAVGVGKVGVDALPRRTDGERFFKWRDCPMRLAEGEVTLAELVPVVLGTADADQFLQRWNRGFVVAQSHFDVGQED